MAEHMRQFRRGAAHGVPGASRSLLGRLRPHDPELVTIWCTARSRPFSDSRFRAWLSGIDPMTAESRARFADALTGMLRDALAPR